MTEIITRGPLQPLSMSSSQRVPRQKASRRADFEDDGARSAKKIKTDAPLNSTAKPAQGRKQGTGKKLRAAYEEDADGFGFSRKRSKRVAKKDPSPDPEQEASKGTRAPPGKRKGDAVDAPPTDGTAPIRRKSSRLSGENTQLQLEELPKSKAKRSRRDVEQSETTTVPRSESPRPVSIQVEKRRRSPHKKIPLPFADTPVITRNKEMRKTSAQAHRRSSSGMRGNRASSLIDSGISNALPHSEVETSEFYKHISQDLPEQRRMKQLLTWCATRALLDKSSPGSGNTRVILAARVIQEELLNDFSTKSEMSEWFNREDVTPAASIKKPNPRNQQNATKLVELEREVERLQDEKSTWDNVLKSLSSSLQSQSSTLDMAKALDASLLSDPEQALLSSNLIAQPDVIASAATRLKDASGSLEFQVDRIAEGIHKLEQFKDTVDGIVDRIQNEAANLLDRRDSQALKSTGMNGVGVRDVLKALSHAGR